MNRSVSLALCFDSATCNHYRKGGPVAEFSEVRLGGVKVVGQLDLSAHTYPKYPAPVVISQAGERLLLNKSWGIPVTIRGAKGPVTKPVTNARNDKLTGFTWRYAAQERRCLIPATGYFEPGLGPAGARGEVLFTAKDRPCFFMAGLWEENAFTMVTTAPNEVAARFHDRMPLVLSDEDALAWLGDSPLPPAELLRLQAGLPAEALLCEELPAKLKIARPSTTPSPASEEQPELL